MCVASTRKHCAAAKAGSAVPNTACTWSEAAAHPADVLPQAVRTSQSHQCCLSAASPAGLPVHDACSQPDCPLICSAHAMMSTALLCQVCQCKQDFRITGALCMPRAPGRAPQPRLRQQLAMHQPRLQPPEHYTSHPARQAPMRMSTEHCSACYSQPTAQRMQVHLAGCWQSRMQRCWPQRQPTLHVAHADLWTRNCSACLQPSARVSLPASSAVRRPP